MKKRDVILAPEARDDLVALSDWIADAVGPATAVDYVERLERYCLGFDVASERGLARSDIRPGLRIVGFERRITIAFSVTDRTVTILRLFYGGRDWQNEAI